GGRSAIGRDGWDGWGARPCDSATPAAVAAVASGGYDVRFGMFLRGLEELYQPQGKPIQAPGERRAQKTRVTTAIRLLQHDRRADLGAARQRTGGNERIVAGVEHQRRHGDAAQPRL